MPDRVIEVEGLVKSFGALRALDGLDISLEQGEVRGLFGPEGAGKSTTVRILLGMVRRSGGHVRLFGADPWRRAATLHRRLSYVPGDVALWPGLSGGQCIDVLGASGAPVDPARRTELVERFDLDPSKRVRDYSKGDRQKVALVAAFATRADLLVLDEPTSQLDPLTEQIFRECVAERAAAGTTVLLSSTSLSEVETICSTVTIIKHGRSIRQGTVAEMRRLSRTAVRAITLGPVPDLSPFAFDVHDLVIEPARPHATDNGGEHDSYEVSFTVDPAELDVVLRPLLLAGLEALTVRPPSLDEVFLDEYEGAPT